MARTKHYHLSLVKLHLRLCQSNLADFMYSMSVNWALHKANLSNHPLHLYPTDLSFLSLPFYGVQTDFTFMNVGYIRQVNAMLYASTVGLGFV